MSQGPQVAAVIEIDPSQRHVRRIGELMPIGARAFDVLLALAQAQGRLVTKRALLDGVWPDSVVEENNLTVQVSALRRVLGAGAIATVSGRGYQLVQTATIRAREVASTAESTPLELPDRPSLVVLAFDDLSGERSHEYLADGLVEDLTTELSRFSELIVVSRNSAFSFKGRNVDVRTIGRELGVRYVIEGSIRWDAGHLRVSAQLIEASSGAHVWAERYDRDLQSLRQLQEEITRSIVAEIAPQVALSEARRSHAESVRDLNAYEMAMKAWSLAHESLRSPEDARRSSEAVDLARRALARDPRCSRALRAIAIVCVHRISVGVEVGLGNAGEAFAEGMAACAHAIEIDPADHNSYIAQGMLHLFSRNLDHALVALRRAIELNPNDAQALAYLGFCEGLYGRPDDGLPLTAHALRLSPRDPRRPLFLGLHAWCQFSLGDYACAVAAAHEALNNTPNLPTAHLCLAISFAGLGRIEEAKRECDWLRRAVPGVLAERLAGAWLFRDPENVQRATDLLHLASRGKQTRAF